MRGAGIASVSGRAASIFAPQAVAVLYAYNGVNGVIDTVIAMAIAQAFIMALFGIETTGRSLDSEYVGAHEGNQRKRLSTVKRIKHRLIQQAAFSARGASSVLVPAVVESISSLGVAAHLGPRSVLPSRDRYRSATF